MRALLWFLLCGAVVFGGLLGGVQPAQADDDLSIGTYKGIISLAVHSRAGQHMSSMGGTIDTSVTINWFGDGYLDLKITDAKNGVAKLSDLPVEIFDFGYGRLTGEGVDCFVSVGLKAKGAFYDMGLGIFDPQTKTGKVPLIFSGLRGHEVIYDTVQGCPLNSMVENQVVALEQTSNQLGTITLEVISFTDDVIRGKCGIDGWEGGGSIPNGSYDHIVDACYWWASKEGDNEWKSK
jgi:hypothetical protein